MTPDRRYIIVRRRLWRASDPDLDPARHRALVDTLMDARRAVAAGRRAGDDVAIAPARSQVDDAKQALAERGPVWWRDGAPDLNRHKVETSPYADWFVGQTLREC